MSCRLGQPGEFDLAYFQSALHQLDDPICALRAATEAGFPAPIAIDLASGASLFVAERHSTFVAS